MRISFTTMATPDLNGVEAIKLAGKFGYGGIDLRISEHKGELTESSSDKEIRLLRNALSSEGIQPASLFCYNAKAEYNNTTWQEMVDSILRNMDIAYKLGSPSIRIFAGDPRIFNNQEDYIKKTADAINKCLEKHDSGIKLLVQNHVGGFTAMHAEKAIMMIDNLRFKLAFSPDHCLLEKEDLDKVYSISKKITGQFYVADMDIPDDGGKAVSVFPGMGNVDIKTAYQSIGGKEFDGWITFKWERIWKPEIENAETALPRFIDYIEELYESL